MTPEKVPYLQEMILHHVKLTAALAFPNLAIDEPALKVVADDLLNAIVATLTARVPARKLTSSGRGVTIEQYRVCPHGAIPKLPHHTWSKECWTWLTEPPKENEWKNTRKAESEALELIAKEMRNEKEYSERLRESHESLQAAVMRLIVTIDEHGINSSQSRLEYSRLRRQALGSRRY